MQKYIVLTNLELFISVPTYFWKWQSLTPSYIFYDTIYWTGNFIWNRSMFKYTLHTQSNVVIYSAQHKIIQVELHYIQYNMICVQSHIYYHYLYGVHGINGIHNNITQCLFTPTYFVIPCMPSVAYG